MTIFCYDFPFEFVMRIWDCFFNEGIKFIFRFILALFKIFEKDILALNEFVPLMTFVQSFASNIVEYNPSNKSNNNNKNTKNSNKDDAQSNNTANDIEYVLKQSFSIKIKHSHLLDAANKYKAFLVKQEKIKLERKLAREKKQNNNNTKNNESRQNQPKITITNETERKISKNDENEGKNGLKLTQIDSNELNTELDIAKELQTVETAIEHMNVTHDEHPSVSSLVYDIDSQIISLSNNQTSNKNESKSNMDANLADVYIPSDINEEEIDTESNLNDNIVTTPLTPHFAGVNEMISNEMNKVDSNDESKKVNSNMVVEEEADEQQQ